jgi:fucose permease
VYAGLYAESALGATISSAGVGGARITLLIGAVVSAVAHAALCFGIHSSMVRTFDMTVRKLAGGR